jgi:hypothetical protein
MLPNARTLSRFAALLLKGFSFGVDPAELPVAKALAAGLYTAVCRLLAFGVLSAAAGAP